MAKLIVSDSNMKYWALTKAEDYIVIDAIDKIEKFVSKADDKFNLLLHTYFIEGKMLGDFALICLNDNRRRKGFPPIHFMEGHSDSHTLLRGTEKATIREAIRLQLQNLSEEQRELVLEQRRIEIDKQAGRDPVYDAIKATRKPVSGEPPTRMAEQLRGLSLPVPAPHTTILPAKGAKPRQLPQSGPAEMLANALAPKLGDARGLITIPQAVKKIEVRQPEQRTQHRQVWITKGIESKRIDRSEMSRYTAEGWEAGRTISKCWVTDGVESKQVSLLVAEELIARGWEIGRQETNRWMVNGSDRRMAKPEEVGDLLKSGWVFGMKLDGAEEPLDAALAVDDSTLDTFSNKDLEVMAKDTENDVDLDRVEAALARRRAKAQEQKSPTLEEFKTLQDQFKALQDQNLSMQGEFTRLKRLVLEFAAA